MAKRFEIGPIEIFGHVFHATNESLFVSNSAPGSGAQRQYNPVVINTKMRIRCSVTVGRLIFVGLVVAGACAMARAAGRDAPLETVAKVDLSRYVGRWYEIAKYPNWFERKCARDVTATYATRPDGKISVVNRCTKQDGTGKESSGWAKVVDAKTNAKLKVTFFWPFFGDFWILELGANYEYVVVGEPSRKYLWILSRTAKMDETVYAGIVSRLAAKGYDAGKLERMRQGD